MFYVATNRGLSCLFDGGESFTVQKDHINYEAIMKLIKANGAATKLEDFEKLFSVKKSIESFEFEGTKLILNDTEVEIHIDGKKEQTISSKLLNRIIAIFKAEDEVLKEMQFVAIVRFIRNLYQNPSYRSVKELYGFLEKNELPITQDGTFLAYKKVRYDYMDIHSGTFDNSIGKVCEMARHDVEDNSEVTCSSGLHACSFDYLENYGSSDLDRIVVVEINPKDVVSIPIDYNHAKLRCCYYKVVDEIPAVEVQLSKYISGRHKDGWLMETFGKLVDFYKSFFKIDYVGITENYGHVYGKTQVVVNKFYSKLEEAGIKVPETMPRNGLPTVCELLTVLSKYDSEWIDEQIDGKKEEEKK